MISKSQSLSKTELIRVLHLTKIDKIEVFDGFKRVEDIKRQIDHFLKDGSASLILIRER
jgi:hypothetical protein